MRACSLVRLAVCGVLLACLSSAACAQVTPSPLTPTDDSITTLIYTFSLNGTVLGNGTFSAWNPIVCQAVNGASVQLVSRTTPAFNKTGYLEYKLTAQAFLYSVNCTGRPLPTQVGLDAVVPDVPSNGAQQPFHFHSFPEAALNGFEINGMFDLEIPEPSNSSSSSTGAGPIPPPTPKYSSSSSTGPAPAPAPPAMQYFWTLNYHYTYAGKPYTGTHVGDSVCTEIAGNFSLLWTAEASLSHGPTKPLLLNNSVHYFPTSLDCKGRGMLIESEFNVTSNTPQKFFGQFDAKVEEPVQLLIGSTFELDIELAPFSSSSTGGGNTPNDDGHHGMSKGTKTLLIVLGSVAGALALLALFCCVCKKKKVEQHHTSAHYQTMAH